MTFINFNEDYKPKQKETIYKSPRNFKSYIKRLNSQPVVVMCSEDIDLIEECKKNSIKFHIIKGTKYLVESKEEKITIRNVFDENGIIQINKKNTIVLKEDNKIVEKLKNLGLEILGKNEIKEKLNGKVT